MISGHSCNRIDASWVPVWTHMNECFACEGEVQIIQTPIIFRGAAIACPLGWRWQRGQPCVDRGKLQRRQQNQPSQWLQLRETRVVFSLKFTAENAHKTSQSWIPQSWRENIYQESR